MDALTPATKPLRRVRNLGLGRALAERRVLEKHGKTALAAATAKQLRHRLLSLKKLAANPEIYTWWCSTPLGVHRLGKRSTLHLTMCAGGGQKENTFRQVIQGYGIGVMTGQQIPKSSTRHSPSAPISQGSLRSRDTQARRARPLAAGTLQRPSRVCRVRGLHQLMLCCMC